MAKKVIVSDIDRHVIAFGADSIENLGVQDPLMIRFSSQNDPTQWFPRTTNTADFRRLSGGTEIVTAVQTRQETLVFTDASLHTMQFVGPPFIFSINQISGQTTIMGQTRLLQWTALCSGWVKKTFICTPDRCRKCHALLGQRCLMILI